MPLNRHATGPICHRTDMLAGAPDPRCLTGPAMAPIAPQSGLGYQGTEGTAEIIAQLKCGYILMVASPQREAAVPIVTHPPR
jgi:hypothetical protein